jgi:hypothetical protein
MSSDAELIAQLRALLELHGRVKQPWSYDRLEKATVAALPRLLELAEKGLDPNEVAGDNKGQHADSADAPDPTLPLHSM